MFRNTIRPSDGKVRHVANRPLESHWCGTHDAARALHLSPSGVRYLADSEQLPHQRMGTGRRLFLKSQILDLAAARARHLLELVPAGVPPPPPIADDAAPPRQLVLFRPRLRMAKAHWRDLQQNLGERPAIAAASDKPRYVAR